MQHYKPYFEKIGDKGNVVFFLHGYGGNRNSFRKTVNMLSKNHICYVFDLHGFGDTPHPNKKMDTYEYAISIYLFCINERINELSIVGHSFGGRIAILLSAIFSLNIKKLVLTSSAGLKPKRGIGYYFKVWSYKLLHKLKFNTGKLGSIEYRQIAGYKRESYVAIVNQSLDYLLKKIKCNVMLFWGRKDKSTPMYMFRKLQRCINKTQSYLFNDSGHFAYLEHNKEFNELTNRFLLEKNDD